MRETSEKILALFSTLVFGCGPGFEEPVQLANIVECWSEAKARSCDIHQLAGSFLVLLSEGDFNVSWLVWWLPFRLSCFLVSEALGIAKTV